MNGYIIPDNISKGKNYGYESTRSCTYKYFLFVADNNRLHCMAFDNAEDACEEIKNLPCETSYHLIYDGTILEITAYRE
ncbi:MAG: hypothetical protein J6S23_02675 [Clostridia bacterium]|nr:hypothetical protein [Clostridia bacterium]